MPWPQSNTRQICRMIDPERMGLLGLSQGGVTAPSAAARDARIDVTVLWSPVSIPYATYTLGIFQPGVVEAGLNAEKGEVVPSPILTGVTLKLKRPFFEGLLKVDPVAEIVRFIKPLMVVVGLQDAIIKPKPQMDEIYLRYHKGEEALVKLDANHFLNIPEQSADLDKAIAWSADWFIRTLVEEEQHE